MTWSEQPLHYMAFNQQRHTAIKRAICNLLLVQKRREREGEGGGVIEIKGKIIKLKGEKLWEMVPAETVRVCLIARTPHNIILKSKFGRLYINKLVKMNRFFNWLLILFMHGTSCRDGKCETSSNSLQFTRFRRNGNISIDFFKKINWIKTYLFMCL